MHFGAYDAFRLVIDHTKPSVELQSLLRAVDVNNNGIIEPYEVATNLEGFSVELENLVLSMLGTQIFRSLSFHIPFSKGRTLNQQHELSRLSGFALPKKI